MRAVLLLPLLAGALHAQLPPDLARERAEYARWLAEAPNSPLAALSQVPLGSGVRVGPPDSEVPIPGFGPARISEAGGAMTFEGPEGRRPLPRSRITTVGGVTFYPGGPAGRTVVTVFGPDRREKQASYFPYNPALVFVGGLVPADPRAVRILALDGVEVEAVEVGSVVVPDSGEPARLRVYRVPDPGTGESDLMIYFRDATGGHGSYPAGRFVVLLPLPDGRYRLDFNRARNPFCAYTSVYACPAPWPGNRLRSPVAAGERYEGGGLDVPGSGE